MSSETNTKTDEATLNMVQELLREIERCVINIKSNVDDTETVDAAIEDLKTYISDIKILIDNYDGTKQHKLNHTTTKLDNGIGKLESKKDDQSNSVAHTLDIIATRVEEARSIIRE